MAAAGADVHAARIDTVGGTAVDRFDLTDRNGRRLDDATRAAIVTAISEDVRTRRRRFWSNKLATRSKQAAHGAETPVP